MRDTIYRHGPVLLGVALIILTVVVLLPITGRMNARMESFKDELVRRIESLTGQPVGYTRIAPSVLRYVQIENLRLGPSDETPVLEVRRLRVYYDIRAILRGEFSTAVTEIRIDNSEVAIDPAKQAELFDALARFRADGGSQNGESPRSDPVAPVVVGGRNVDIRFLENGTSVSAERSFFDVTVGPEAVDVEFRGVVEYTDARIASLGTASAEVSLRGSVSPSFDWASGQVALRDAQTDLFRVGAQDFQVDVSTDSVEVRRIRAEEPVDIFLAIDRRTRSVTGRILAERFDPRDVVQLTGPIESVQQQLPTDVSGSISLGLSFAGGEPRYGVDLDAEFLHPAVSGPVRFAGAVEGTEDHAQFTGFGLTTRYGYARFDGDLALDSLLPEGVLAVENAALRGMEPLTATFDLKRRDGALRVASNAVTYAGVVVDRIRATARPAAGRTTFSVHAALADAGVLTVHGRAELTDEPRLEASLDTRRLGLEEILRVYAGVTGESPVPIDLIAAYQPAVTATVRGWTRSDRYQFDLPRVVVESAVNRSDRIVLSGSAGTNSVRIDRVTGSFAGYAGSGELSAARERAGRLSFATDFQIEGIRYGLTGSIAPSGSVSIEGRYGLEARFVTPPGDATRFWISSGDIPLPAGGEREPALVSFDMDGAFRTVDEWEAVVRNITITSVSLPQENSATVSLAATLGPTGGPIDAVLFQDAFSTVRGRGELSYQLNGEVSAQARISASAGDERYDLSFNYSDSAVSGLLSFADSPVARVGFQALRGDMVGLAEIAGTLSQPEVSLDLSLPEGRFNTDPVSVELSAAFGSDSLTVESLEVGYLTTRIEEASAGVNLATGALQAEGRYINLSEEQAADVVGELSAQFDIGTGPLRLPDLLERSFQATLSLRNLPGRSGGPTDWSLAFDRDDEGIRVEGGPEDSIRGYLAESGDFDLRTVSPFPVSFSADGTVAAGQIETNLNRLRADLQRFPGLTDLGVVRFVAGTANGSIRIVGPINDPDFYGTLVISEASADVDLIPEVVNAEKSYLVFQEKVVRLVPFEAVVGSATVGIEGDFLLNRWGFEGYKLRIDAGEEPGVHIAYDFNAVEVEGFAMGQIEITGAPNSTRFDGSVTAQSTTVTLSEEVVETEGASSSETIVDLTIETGRGLEFLWPTSTFPILRAFTETGETLDLTYSSVDGSFALSGDVGIQGGEIFYFDRNFYVRSGSIRFREDELQFDPELTVTAEIRDIAAEGPVRIYLSAENSPLSEFSPQFTSDPPMSETEIATVLGGNIVGGEAGEQPDLTQAAFLAGDIVQQLTLVQSIQGSMRRALGLDLFTVRTHLFPNLVRGWIEGTMYPLDNPAPSLGQYLDNTTIFLGKYLGTDLFLELLVQLRAENPFEADVRNLGGLSVDYDFSLEWKTPFFLLEWNFFPRTPESLFLTDNTFVFSWEYSF